MRMDEMNLGETKWKQVCDKTVIATIEKKHTFIREGPL